MVINNFETVKNKMVSSSQSSRTEDQDIKDSKNQLIEEIQFDLESISSSESDHVFKDPKLANYYAGIYEESKYECRHLFDPELTWTEKEEKIITRKNDWNVTFWSLIMFTALNLDRGNIGQALSDNMLDDLHLTTNDYNIGQTIFYLCFLAAELPSQLVSKKIGSDIWVPIQMVLWSVISMSQAALKNKAGFYITRALLGAVQGGFICDVCLWLSYFYTSKELPFRLGIFYIANPMTTVWSSLLALGFLQIKSSSIQEGWRWLFLLEGLITLIVGLISFFKMPASVAQTKSWYNKKGWYTEREEKILVNKVLRDDPSKGDLHNRKAVSLKELVKGALDYDLLFIYLCRFLLDIGSNPVSNYLQLVLRSMGYSTTATNALTIPYNVIMVITMLLTTYYSEVLKTRALMLATIPVWIAIHLLILRYWSQAQINKWGTWVLLTFLLGHAPSWPLSISWCSANSNSVRSRAISAAVVNMFSQAGGIVAMNIYRKDDAPLYKRGNTQLIIIAFATLAMILITRQWFIFRNNQRDKKWNSLTKEQQLDYVENTTDKGNKRLDFRFVY